MGYPEQRDDSGVIKEYRVWYLEQKPAFIHCSDPYLYRICPARFFIFIFNQVK